MLGIIYTYITCSFEYFILCKSIFDNVVIMYETFHFFKTLKATKQCSMAVKININKAYNILKYIFIRPALERKAFTRIGFIGWCSASPQSLTHSSLLMKSLVLSYSKVELLGWSYVYPYIFILCGEVFSN